MAPGSRNEVSSDPGKRGLHAVDRNRRSGHSNEKKCRPKPKENYKAGKLVRGWPKKFLDSPDINKRFFSRSQS